MLWPAFQKQSDAVAHAIPRRLVTGFKRIDQSARLGIAEFAAFGQIVAPRVGRHRQQAEAGIPGNGCLQRFADGGVIVNVNHVVFHG